MRKKLSYIISGLIICFTFVGCETRNDVLRVVPNDTVIPSHIEEYEQNIEESSDDVITTDITEETFENNVVEVSTIDESNLNGQNDTKEEEITQIEILIEYTENGIIKPEIARKIIEERSVQVIEALSNSDMELLTKYTHPTKGICFTPYTYVNPTRDLVLLSDDVTNIQKDSTIYEFGIYDGIGDPIRLTWMDYYNEFVYSKDFKNAPEIGYNEIFSKGNMIDNAHEIYKEAIVVEYYFSGFEEEYGGSDWKSLKIVYEEYEGIWYVVGIIHNQWTV